MKYLLLFILIGCKEPNVNRILVANDGCRLGYLNALIEFNIRLKISPGEILSLAKKSCAKQFMDPRFNKWRRNEKE